MLLYASIHSTKLHYELLSQLFIVILCVGPHWSFSFQALHDTWQVVFWTRCDVKSMLTYYDFHRPLLQMFVSSRMVTSFYIILLFFENWLKSFNMQWVIRFFKFGIAKLCTLHTVIHTIWLMIKWHQLFIFVSRKCSKVSKLRFPNFC